MGRVKTPCWTERIQTLVYWASDSRPEKPQGYRSVNSRVRAEKFSQTLRGTVEPLVRFNGRNEVCFEWVGLGAEYLSISLGCRDLDGDPLVTIAHTASGRVETLLKVREEDALAALEQHGLEYMLTNTQEPWDD
jgi:hypothetical protein